MNTQHYADYIIEDTDEHKDYLDILSSVYATIHECIAIDKVTLVVDFPELSEESIGRKVRVFGSTEALEVFSKKPNVQWLISRGEIGSSGTKDVPETDTYVTVRRTRLDLVHGKGSVERKIRRLKNRAISRGEKWTQVHEQRIRNGLREKQVHKSRARIKVSSASTGQSFFVMPERIHGKRSATNDFNSYGLCKGESAIPSF